MENQPEPRTEDGSYAGISSAAPQSETFQTVIGETPVYLHMIKLRRSCFLWIGDGRKRLDSLSVALPNPFDVSKVPLLTSIIDRRPSELQAARDEGQQIASKLSRKLDAQVFVTYNIESNDDDLVQGIEMYLFNLIKTGTKFVL
ncbi:hypothetical protein RvY_08163 [Ramazzottius varieornatus]|uniref:Proteasome assembly chaperone 4 n=1 Tax=Ramazzottius varieornatus TaxID=947166 RepID=A0A1D1V4Y7_RAMVA|nr:hypothetical protein RvY_08163 [Ramazzottius varieornatus]